MKDHIYNNKDSKFFRQTLRVNMPNPEALIWRRLKGKQLGLKFRRQYSIGKYIVDFYCPEIRLAIEIDGDSHFTSTMNKKDIERENFIKNKDIHILRFTNKEILKNLEGVLSLIVSHTTLYPSYLRRGTSYHKYGEIMTFNIKHLTWE